MGRILTGLVETGAWGCFDEFNRLEEATLSAITMLLYPIQVALKTNREQLALFDKQVRNPHYFMLEFQIIKVSFSYSTQYS